MSKVTFFETCHPNTQKDRHAHSRLTKLFGKAAYKNGGARRVPPMMPYVTSIMSMLTEKLLMTKNAAAITLPTIVTVRMPSLLVIALTIGPADAVPRTNQPNNHG